MNRAAVLVAAVELADEEGIDAISMRALAGRLGVVPMALYKHVSDKEDLIGGMIDTVVQAYPAPSAEGWRHRVRARVLAARDAQARHPWMRRAIEGAVRPTPTVLGYMDAVAADFIEAGFSLDLTHYAMHVLGQRIWGFSPEAFSGPPVGIEDEATAQGLAMRFPHVASIAADTAMRNPSHACDERYEFEFALDLLLDAFGRLREAAWTSSPEA